MISFTILDMKGHNNDTSLSLLRTQSVRESDHAEGQGSREWGWVSRRNRLLAYNHVSKRAAQSSVRTTLITYFLEYYPQ